MIRNAFTGEPKPKPEALVQQGIDFTAEGSPPPGQVSGTDVPDTDEPVSPEATAAASARTAPCCLTRELRSVSPLRTLVLSDEETTAWTARDCHFAAVTARLHPVVAEASNRPSTGDQMPVGVLRGADARERLRLRLSRA